MTTLVNPLYIIVIAQYLDFFFPKPSLTDNSNMMEAATTNNYRGRVLPRNGMIY
jgi:hypothetical protein